MKKKNFQLKDTQKLFSIIIVIFILIVSIVAVSSRTQIITRAQNTPSPSGSITSMPIAEQTISLIKTAVHQKERVTISEDQTNTLIAYLLPESKILESVRIALTNDHTVSMIANVLWPFTMEVEAYATVLLESGIPQMDVKEIAFYGIPVPKFLWKKSLSTANERVRKNFIKYNSRIRELTINEDGISIDGEIPEILLDPAYWQKQNTRAEQYTKKMKLSF
jgi:hypothetical protein